MYGSAVVSKNMKAHAYFDFSINLDYFWSIVELYRLKLIEDRAIARGTPSYI